MSSSDYGDIQISRRLGKGVTVDTAPQRAKAQLGLIANTNLYVRVEDGHIVIADQVVYQVTGYDPADYTLTLELIKDWRPGQPDDPGAATQS